MRREMLEPCRSNFCNLVLGEFISEDCPRRLIGDSRGFWSCVGLLERLCRVVLCREVRALRACWFGESSGRGDERRIMRFVGRRFERESRFRDEAE
jgi:hypothetical protein